MHIFQHVVELDPQHTFVAGDFNVLLDCKLDRKGGKPIFKNSQ